ncbi:endonuclease III [Flavobacterium sp. Fl-77]|uniref:Endonuclease III n=1 Tax=Flavobacterium flavipigmentatum TaxID=2893884 RepID=A0AAJ2SFN1_9FLAO|nr:MULTISPECIES: endonuclease III [unclassified Flavobacterium]MDX6182807.1 endonuclease III [Flavobacterium sp. Fl-33]MDX6186260.1 endonuclease III [Flavobacterium sp. Fl-77]UFH37951.1 endonuclease III [Flavobacterium sp. F-70]
MDLFGETSNWETKLAPILAKYQGKKHPLEHQNIYQLMIMVILSAQDSDANINKIAPILFEKFPTLSSLANTDEGTLLPYISKVRNFLTKSKWILDIAKTLQSDEKIPLNMKELVALKGIGRKSANVILREAKQAHEGIIVDLHVIRVAPRIGIVAENKDGNKVENELMKILPQNIWLEIGMAISFLGREICRPTQPKCDCCLINDYCNFYKNKA